MTTSRTEYKTLVRPLSGMDETSAVLTAEAVDGWQVVSATPNRTSRRRPGELVIVLERRPESHLVSGSQIITLDYPVDSVPRYGYGKPAHTKLHELLNTGRDRYKDTLGQILDRRQALSAIPVEAETALDPSWLNNWMPGLDTSALYHFLAEHKPRLYFEVGSGVSTRFARRAIQDNDLPTRIRSIDPHPRVECDDLCDEVIRTRMEDADLALFDELEPGDILFIDSSHRSFMNSDVTVLFLDVLPRLPEGVLLHIHDIRLPYDYPAEWGPRFYSEQYLLAVHLLAGGPGEVLLPNAFISHDAELSTMLDPLWGQPGFERVERHGESFWMRTG